METQRKAENEKLLHSLQRRRLARELLCRRRSLEEDLLVACTARTAISRHDRHTVYNATTATQYTTA